MSAFIQAVSSLWEGDVSVIACHNIRGERAASGFQDKFQWLSEYHVLENKPNPDEFAKDYILQNTDCIHVFCGLRREPANYMYLLKSINKSAKIVAITEKPAPNSGRKIVRFSKKLLFPIYYRYIYGKTQKTVQAMFVFSVHGVDFVKKHGWKKQNLYDFMYCDQIPDRLVAKQRAQSNYPHFLYVGRFNYRMRGLDVIMKAFDNIDGEWSLALVGGYGEEKDAVISWANAKPRVEYLGRWQSDEVAEKMQDYDVYICASKEDSWNGQTNLALSAGLAVLTTTEAGSDELVKSSGAGLVLPAGDCDSLREAVERVISNPDELAVWKKRAREYAQCITTESVAKYFINVLKKEIYGIDIDTGCPWMK